MEKRYLITTAIQQTWPQDLPVLFLGEWCKRFSAKDIWQKMEHETVGYHWDDREKLYDDYLYLNDLYEDTLKKLSDRLNAYHEVNRSERYWRIVIGPWLGQFIQIVFDRWQMLDRAVTEYDISGTTVLQMDKAAMIPTDMSDFISKCSGEEWNHYIYAQILGEISSGIKIDVKQCEGKNRQKDNVERKVFVVGFFLSRIKKITRSFLSWLTGNLIKHSKYFFIDTFLSNVDQTKLEFSLKKIPSCFMTRYDSQGIFSDGIRSSFPNMGFSSSRFEKFLYEAIPDQIPMVYLEGYNKLNCRVNDCSWPRKPKVIMTYTAHINYDFFKVWAADKVEEGAKLVVGQHANIYGCGKFFFYEAHELKICDKYFSWGWRECGSDKIIPNSPVRIIKSKAKLKCNPTGGLLQVLTSLPRYSYHLYSSPISAQMKVYEEEQLRFSKSLSTEIRDQLIVRPYIVDYGWDQKERWKEQFPKVRFDDSRSFYTTMGHNRLLVGTANSTIFLESLSANIPIISFWNPVYWELRESAQPYYDLLVDLNILHTSPESAADFVNEIWNELESWWHSYEVQKARTDFCENFANSQEKWIEQWKENLINVAAY